MATNRPYTAVNPSNPKRRFEARSFNGPPAKKARHEHETYQKSYSASAGIVLPEPLPELPPISEDYAKMVFTHPSYAMKGELNDRQANYDRLEYLGDAYIEIIATKLIFESYPTTNAGGMCRLRESVVKNETLSKYSIAYGFDKKLRIQELPRDGKTGWVKIYGDVFEAYSAAVVLSDARDGESRLKSWLTALWAPVLREVKTQLPSENVKSKEELANMIAMPGVKLTYVEERRPISHVGQGQETFFIGVYMDGWGWANQHLGSGEGKSKVIAGQAAASNALKNHPLIDEIIAKKQASLAQRESQKQAENQ